MEVRERLQEISGQTCDLIICDLKDRAKLDKVRPPTSHVTARDMIQIIGRGGTIAFVVLEEEAVLINRH